MRPRNQTQSVKNSSNAFSPEIASYIWARFTQKNSSQNLAKKKWKNFLIIMKLSSQVTDGKVFGTLNHKYVFDGSLRSARNNQSGSSERRL